MRHAPSWAVIALLSTFWSCTSAPERHRPDPAMAPYVAGFTAGHISARSPIMVRLAEGVHWRDTSHATLQGLFSFDPKVRGHVRLEDDGQTVVFRPEERLQQDRAYTVDMHLGRLIEVPAGAEKFRFGFRTVRQHLHTQVDEMQPLSLGDPAWQRLLVAVYTSDDATGTDLPACFIALQDDRKLPLVWEHDPDGRHHRFTVDSVRRGDQTSTVQIRWDGKPIGTKQADKLVFEVPAANEMHLIAARTTGEGEQHATLIFSDPIDPAQEITGLVGIADAEDMRLAVDGQRVTMYPRERLRGTHQAFVSAGLRSALGHGLGRDLTVDLTFEELKPAVRMVGKGTILPSTDGLVMPFEAVNLKAVEVRVVRIHETNVAQFLQVNSLDGEREMARVGRLVTRTTLPLNTADAPDPGQWNRYYLDLSEHFKAEPGAIYRVALSFGPEHAIHPCADGMPQALSRARSWEEEQAAYDQVDHWYYDVPYSYDDHYYYDEDYDAHRNDPCHGLYYALQQPAVRNLLASDLGLIAKRGNDGSLVVAATDLRTTASMSGVQLELIDLQRKTLATATTDRQGMATIAGTAHKPFLLKAEKGEQRGYLKMDDGSALSVSSFDVGGTAVDRGLKGFIYGERGVWRPGDTLHLSFMLHDEQQRLPKDHPVVLEITDPRGRLDQKHVRNSGVNGVYTFHCPTSPDAPTGYWNARVVVGGTTFHKSLRIETIKPNRLRIALDLPEDQPITAGRQVGMEVSWLHGAPAKGSKARVTTTLSPGKPNFKGYTDHTFDDLHTHVGEAEQVLFEGTLDQHGRARFPLRVTLGQNPPAVVNASIVTRVFEAGGDASMDRLTLPYLPYSSYVGVKAPDVRTAWGNLLTDTTYRFQTVTLDQQGRPLAGRQVRAQVYRLGWNWWWDADIHGDASYINAPSVTLVKEEMITTGADGRAHVPFRVDRPAWGRFAVRLTDVQSGHSCGVQVYVDWPGYEGRSRREAPEQAAMLRFNSDRERYTVGDEAVLTIPSAPGGRALVSLETGSRVLQAQWVELTGTETQHRFRITPDMAPNIYAHVTVVQPHATTLNDLPIRLYGVVPLLVEDPHTRLAPLVRSPKEVRTDQPFSVEVAEQNGRPMTYTLAIVDEGLLDLTRFRTPDPWNHFHAREALGVRTWDLYDHVIGAFGRQLDRILALGGSDDAGRGDAARVQRFKPVVRFVGPFQLGKGAKAKHDFTISNYVGSVRVMVVATDGNGAYGHAEQAVPVRKPLMVLATLPRVLGPGETANLPVTVFAMDPKVKDVEVKIEPNDLLVPEGPSTRTIRFNSPGEQVVEFRVKVKEQVGAARVTVQATGGGEKAIERIELRVRQPNEPATDVEEVVLEPGDHWTGTLRPLGLAGTNSAYLELSTVPPVDLGRRLQYLVGYPHGCLEQTTSKAFPQLYLAQVMELPASFAQDMRANVEAGLRQLTRFQRHDGHFNYWPGGDHYDPWTSVYAGHFMVEAERLGHAVPGGLLRNWTSAQRKAAREWTTRSTQGWSAAQAQLLQAYRLYVLALAGQAEAGAMNRLREDAGLTGTARWLLASAYTQIGRTDAARDLVSRLDDTVQPYSEMGFSYGSELRDEALVAESLLRIGETARATRVVQRIGRKLSSTSWYSTQSTAFGLMAVARLAELGGMGEGLHYGLTVGDKRTDHMSPKALARMDLPTPDGRTAVRVQHTGKGLLHLRIVRTGTPMAGDESAVASGLHMDVEYQRMDGTPIDPGRIEQGTDLMAVVRVVHPGGGPAYNNLALTQVFPSGWEIRNMRMEGRDAAGDAFAYQDIRDDRVLTYFDLVPGRPVTFKVLLNAAYTGRYYLPGPHCTAMYDHTIQARGKGRWVQVVKPGGEVAKAE
jgi:uncharacterized protein YfaS (alpha-2-macroglobulin family)